VEPEEIDIEEDQVVRSTVIEMLWVMG